ncbi:translation initiation factor IF-2 N-terminal domain-containing protein, partial [Sporosarcina limicola]|uniref:translation initiation factor IF-2 N-terminal domain-containing protein n=1 Tax=Sporosarcina limicola TaxID=34101 RepID=UPI001CEF3F67
MTKIRVHEYAKRVNKSSKEVIDELSKINVSVTNHMSTIDKEVVSKLDNKFSDYKKESNAPKVNPAPKSDATQKAGQNRPAQSTQGTTGGQSAARPSARPAQGGQSRPAQSGGQSRPGQSTSGQSANRPAARPAQGGGQSRPGQSTSGQSANRPAARPAQGGGQSRPGQS